MNQFSVANDAVYYRQHIPFRMLKSTAAAGPPAEINESDVEVWALIFADCAWMPNKPQDYTCVHVRCDSMYPVLADGDLVAIDHAERSKEEREAA